MFHPLQNVLADRLNQQGIGKAIAAVRVTEVFRDIVKELIGNRAAMELRKVAYRDDTVEVLAGSGALASELRMREREIKDKLRAAVRGRDIRLKIFG